MIAYLDTSVVLRRILNQPDSFADWAAWERAYASELMGLEGRRTIDRLRLAGALDDRGVAQSHQQLGIVEDAIAVLLIDRTVINRASLPMPTAVKSLDAIHLASAQLCRENRVEQLSFVTHDVALGRAAAALGFPVLGCEL